MINELLKNVPWLIAPFEIFKLTKLLYLLLGFSASLLFATTLYRALRLDSNLDYLIINTKSTPLYFWPYVALTLGTIVLFGVNISFFVYRWRKFGFPRRSLGTGEAVGTGLGSAVAITASACSVCGSTILAAVGIAGGLTAFPFGGLELKALSLVLLILPIWLTLKDIRKLENDCENGNCPALRDHSFKKKDWPWFLGLLLLTVVLLLIAWRLLKTDPATARFLANRNQIPNSKDGLSPKAKMDITKQRFIDEIAAKVLPENGFQSKIRLEDSLLKLVGNGVIDRKKVEAIYQNRGGLPPELKGVLTQATSSSIVLTKENASLYVNLLWPLGLANYLSENRKSPILGKSLFNFASTGGWNLGKKQNGASYFNKFRIVRLTKDQEALVINVAQNTYRPCCNNSTFYQDCNHGSALLGLLELGASQGLTEDELYREALGFNSFWFPQNYVQTALYFKVVRNTDWEDVNPKIIMGKNFSTYGGWSDTVAQKISELGLLPTQAGGAGCGV